MADFLILGGDSTLAQYFSKKYSKECILLSKNECDITNRKILEKAISISNCKYILNCAALTDINYCQDNFEECFNVNTLAVSYLTEIVNKNNKKLIHISSDYAKNPINVYGYSKFLSEMYVNSDTDLVIRTSFFSPKYFIIKSLLLGQKTSAYENMYFNPVSVVQLVEQIYNLKDSKGLINIFSDKKISKYEFAKLFAKTNEIDESLIEPTAFIQKPDSPKLPLDSYVEPDVKLSLQLSKYF